MYFAFFRSKGIADQICKSAHALQKFSFTCSFIIGYCRFHQMSGCIQFVPFAKVCPAFVWFFDRKISINISILALCVCNQVDYFIRCFFQRLIRIAGKREPYCFQPFGNICILKNSSIKITFSSSCCNFKILQTMAGFCIRNSVVHCFPLIRDNCISYKVNMFRPEWIADGNFF